MIRYHPALTPLLMPAAFLHPHPDNPNNGDVDALIESITVNGCYRPIYALPDGTIVAGHTLNAALAELGADKVPVLTVAPDDGGRRIMLADNRIAALARMDEPLLTELLATIAQTPTALAGTGYDDENLLALLERAERDASTPLKLTQFTRTCPNCGHTWRDG